MGQSSPMRSASDRLARRESQVPADLREYIKHKTNQQFEKIREMMKEEGFKATAPATQPAATPTTKAATKQVEDL